MRSEKQGLHPAKIRMISVMPCTSKKYEITRSQEMFASGHQDVDVSLTTREITRMIHEFLDGPLSEKAKKLLHTSYQPLPEYRR